MGGPLVCLATCAEARGLDEDEPLLVAELSRLGCRVAIADWHGSVDWGQFDVVVIRSTWDYYRRPQEFVEWIEAVAQESFVMNDPAALTWNFDKRYLTDLASYGVPVAETYFVSLGTEMPRSAIGMMRSRPFVMKPSISAGAYLTTRFPANAIGGADRWLKSIHASGRDVMVQPNFASVQESGETSLIYLSGQFSHAVRKWVTLSDCVIETANSLYQGKRVVPATPTEQELATGESALSAVRKFVTSDLLYARVDVVRGDDDEPTVLEVELIEPNLSLCTYRPAARVLASGIRDHLERRRQPMTRGAH